MNAWNSGYITDVSYTYGYFPELNPLRVEYALCNAGFVSPRITTACELGFGQGLSVNIHAAASSVAWYGTDFNPSQVGLAKELAHASQADIHLFDDAFADFVHRNDLPEFDFIGIHGIWSWINEDNRRYLVEFIKRYLKVGGVLYVSYNTFPGCSDEAQLRYILSEYASSLLAVEDEPAKRVNVSVEFVEKLVETEPMYFKANPLVKERLAKLKGQSWIYLLHEYFNKHWNPMYFSSIAKYLVESKVSYVCSAELLEHVDALHLSKTHQDFLQNIPSINLRQTLRDFMTNQRFRRDYWVKGPRHLSSLDRIKLLEKKNFILTVPTPNFPLKINGFLGESLMNEQVYGPIFDLIGNHKSISLTQIIQTLAAKNITRGQVIQALGILLGAGHVTPVYDLSSVKDIAKKQTNLLNSHILNMAYTSHDIDCLASPVSGGGVWMNRIQQLFLLATEAGHSNPNTLATYVWNILSSQGQSLRKDDKSLDTPEENIAELSRQAVVFQNLQAPILKSLYIL